MSSGPLDINDIEEPCRACEVILGLGLLLPLVAFLILAADPPEQNPIPWPLLSVIIGLPLAFVGVRFLLVNERTRRRGLLPPWLLYLFGGLMIVGPLLSNSNWAGIGFGLMLVHAARQRQLIRARMKAEGR